MQKGKLRPLLVFGLGGTLLARSHPRKAAAGMPLPDLTVGVYKVWLRPQMLSTLLALQQHCDLAIWSSTTARNTNPVVDAVFRSERTLRDNAIIAGDAAPRTSVSPTPEKPSAGDKTKRFQKREKKEDPTAVCADPKFDSPFDFKFVWSREHTIADDFRRLNAVTSEDNHATVKDLSKVYQAFPGLATPQNTILVDDTPSKAKCHIDNLLWIDSCDGLSIKGDHCMHLLREFVETKVTAASDVRALLPHRLTVPPTS